MNVGFEWNRSEVLGLAKESCTQCQGFGLRGSSKTGSAAPCNCVFRSVFRACYRRFRFCATQEKQISTVRLEQVQGKDHRQTWGMKNEEYMADFVLTAKRVLDESEYKIFKFHYLLGADWKLCCRQMKLERGEFFHEVYRIQHKLGRMFRETRPHSLFPLDEYFGGSVRSRDVRSNVVTMPGRFKALVPPLRKVA